MSTRKFYKLKNEKILLAMLKDELGNLTFQALFILSLEQLAQILLNMGSQNICCAQDQVYGGNILFNLKGATTLQKQVSLTEQQQAFVHSKNLFPNQLKKVLTLKLQKEDIFEGELDTKGNPVGFGIFKNGNEQSVYFGNFSQLSTENGKLFYILPNGSYYEGNLMAQSGISGIYVQPQLKYRYEGELQLKPGQQLRYVPHGTGTQNSTAYEFSGKFVNGKRVEGKLKWTENNFEFQYQGQFDQNQLFTGQGVLKEKTGEYSGNFVKGQKEGYGKYVRTRGLDQGMVSGLRYEGNYREGKKNGHGKIFNSDGSLSYDGEFNDGLPHGIGVAYTPKTSKQTQFYQGITKQDYTRLTEDANLSKQSLEL